MFRFDRRRIQTKGGAAAEEDKSPRLVSNNAFIKYTIAAFITHGNVNGGAISGRTLPTWLTTIVKKMTIWRNGGLGILQLHQAGGRVIAHSALVGRLEDYSDLGTLFSLWEAVRLHPDRDTIETMLSYLDYMCLGRIAPVEEAGYYKKRLEKLSGRRNR